MSLNEKIFILINQKLASPILDFLIFFILIPLASFLVILPFSYLFSQKNRKLGIFSLFSGVFCYFFGTVLKNFFKFPRPYEIPHLQAILKGPWHAGLYSFPSTTTMLVFGLALPFFFSKSKYSIPLLTLAFLIGFSVIYTGFHFPFDVIAGILLSFLLVYFFLKIFYKIK